MDPRVRIAILAVVSFAAIVAVILHGPIPQPVGYHTFADQRALLGISNFGNVMSNLAFLLVGAVGIREFLMREPPGVIRSLRSAYLCLFAGIVLVGLGSGFYHFAPSDDALVWDRLPMTIAFMALFAIVIGEHIDPQTGLRLAAPLVIAGVGSVVYWHFSGDLRPYVVVQFLPLLLIPLILLLYPSRLSGVGYLWALLGAYVLAKLLEKADEAIFAWDHIVSGHTLKHLSAGLGMYLFVLAVRRRRLVTVATVRVSSAPAIP